MVYLSFNFDFYFSKIIYYDELEIVHAKRTNKCLRNQGRTKGEGCLTANLLKPPVILWPAVPRRLFCFVCLVILDVACRYLSLFVLYINTEIGKNRR